MIVIGKGKEFATLIETVEEAGRSVEVVRLQLRLVRAGWRQKRGGGAFEKERRGL